MTRLLSPRRVGLLMRHDLAMQKKSLITGFATIAGIIFGAFLIASASGGQGRALEPMILNILLVGGYVAASVVFAELHDAKQGVHYLMLPGSTIEKYLGRLLLTSVGWTAAVIATAVAASALGALVAGVFFETRPDIFFPTSRAVWVGVATFVATQPIFLFGSIYFRKVAFLKVTLATIVTALSLGIVYLIGARLFFAPLFTGLFETTGDPAQIVVSGDMTLEQLALERFVPILDRAQKALRWVIIPVFFWVAGVLRLRETEV